MTHVRRPGQCGEGEGVGVGVGVGGVLWFLFASST